MVVGKENLNLETRTSKVVYICGPYSGGTFKDVEQHIATARTAAIYLAQNRVGYFCPHLNSAHFDDILPQVKYQYWMDLYLTMLHKCDALVTVSGWERSEGATLEVAYANSHQVPVFHSIRKCVQFIKSLSL